MTVAIAGVVGTFASPSEIVDGPTADRARIQRHLAAVEADLRSADTSALTPELRRNRLRNLDRLHAYRVTGEFPRNGDFVGQRVPYFIDDGGTACAVGHLVIESGADDVAQEIRRTENNALLREMTHPSLQGWIAESGLTALECARIQPSYCGCGDEYEPVCGVDGTTYANACTAETCAAVEIAHEGVCEPETTTDWPPAGTSGVGDGGATTDPTTSTGGTGSSTAEPSDDDGAASTRRGCGIGRVPSLAWCLPLLVLVRRRTRVRA